MEIQTGLHPRDTSTVREQGSPENLNISTNSEEIKAMVENAANDLVTQINEVRKTLDNPILLGDTGKEQIKTLLTKIVETNKHIVRTFLEDVLQKHNQEQVAQDLGDRELKVKGMASVISAILAEIRTYLGYANVLYLYEPGGVLPEDELEEKEALIANISKSFDGVVNKGVVNNNESTQLKETVIALYDLCLRGTYKHPTLVEIIEAKLGKRPQS